MEKVITNISKILLIISLLILPIMLIGGLFGLAGSTAKYYSLIWIGYLGLIVSSLVCIFRYKFFPLIIISLLLIFSGVYLDTKFWTEHNQGLCEELRAEPSCIEDECGFDCSNFHGAGFVTGGSICKDKDMNLCREKTIQSMNDEKEANDAIGSFSNIVDIIISSPNPTDENFEDQLVAIYNCLEIKYGPGAKGELMAVQALKNKNLDQDNLNKYYDYLAAHGRNPSRQVIVAGLPNGDKNLSCEDINY